MSLLDSVKSALGLGASAPTAPSDQGTGPELPWTTDDTTQWQSRLSAAREFIQNKLPNAKKNVRRYRGKYLDADPIDHTVCVPADFYYTEQKRAQLFYRVPEVQLTGKTPESEAAAPLFQHVINEYLGPQHTHVKLAMDEGIFDVLCPIAFAVFEVGCDIITAPVMRPTIDPATGQETQTLAPHPVSERYYITRLPPGRFLAPPDFIGADFDDAPWVGYTFWENVPANTPGATTAQTYADDLLSPTASSARYVTPRRKGTRVFYRARALDPSVTDSRIIREFVWYEGDPTPKIHKPCAAQRVLPDGTVMGIQGFPVKVLKIRSISDDAYPPSDCEITRNLVDEQSKGRTQMLVHRDRSLPQNLYDSTRVGKDALQKIERGEVGGFIGVAGNPNEMFLPLAKAHIPNETYTFNSISERDLDKAWALGANQQGVSEQTSRTATELNLIQANADTRLDYERDKVIDFFCNKIAASLGALLQLHADRMSYVRVLGQDGAMRLEAWNRASIQGEFAFGIKINSQLRPDAASDQRRIMEWVNYSAKSPYINQAENWRLVTEAFGFDPARLTQQPPPSPPEPPKVALSFKGEDLNPLAPQYANVLTILQAQGLTGLTPPAPPPNALTTGTVDRFTPLDKHAGDQTGQLPGMGSAVTAAQPAQPQSVQ